MSVHENQFNTTQMGTTTAGFLWLITSIFTALLKYIDFIGLYAVVKDIAPIFTIFSAIMAIRHFYYATKKIKK